MASIVAKAAAAAAVKPHREIPGVVVSAGLMQRTVKVQVGGQKWNSLLKKVRSP
jgi:small subunit ribosomal protein S17